jgi:hypothetical protein
VITVRDSDKPIKYLKLLLTKGPEAQRGQGYCSREVPNWRAPTLLTKGPDKSIEYLDLGLESSRDSQPRSPTQGVALKAGQ